MKLGHSFCFTAPTHNSTGSVDADALPSAVVYEDHGAALGYAPTVAKVDTGEYHVYGTASAANGFQVGHDYNVVMVAVIGGQTWKSRVGQFTVDDNGIDDVSGAVAALNDVSAADVETACEAALSDYGAATGLNVKDVQDVTDKLNTAMEADGPLLFRFTANALEEAPSGGGYTPEDVADAVLDASVGDHVLLGSVGMALAALSSVPAVFVSKSESAAIEVKLSVVVKALISAAPGLGDVYSFRCSDKDGSRCDGMVRYVVDRSVVRVSGGSASLSPYTLAFEISDSSGMWKWTHAMASVAVTR